MEAQAAQLEEVRDSEERYQLATYKKMPIVAERGEGVWIYTSDGEKYLDLYGGHAVAGTGHSHPHVVAAIQAQAEKLLFYSNLVYSEARARAAEKLVSVAPPELTKAFFCNSGTEANENAMRMARMTTAREHHHLLRRFSRAHRRCNQRYFPRQISRDWETKCAGASRS